MLANARAQGTPMQGSDFSKLLWQALPMPAAILAGENLAQIGAGPHMHGFQGMCGHGPDGAVDGTGQVHFAPVLAVVFADQQTTSTARRPIAVGEKYHTSVVKPGHDGARVLPGRIDGLKLPMQSPIGAAVQALVGGGVHHAFVGRFIKDGDAVNIGRNESLTLGAPSLSVIVADKDATNFDRQPQRVWILRVKQNLCHPGGTHVDVRKLLQSRH